MGSVRESMGNFCESSSAKEARLEAEEAQAADERRMSDERRMNEHRRVANSKTPQLWYTTGTEGGCAVDGVQYRPAECYSMSLELEPTHADAWCQLFLKEVAQ